MLGQLLYVPQNEIDSALFQDDDQEVSPEDMSKLAERLYSLPKPDQEEDHPIYVQGTTSFVEQQPWIQNMTLRRNILFEKEFEPRRYVETIHACQLDSDLKLMPAGDRTEIGERGVTLSGG